MKKICFIAFLMMLLFEMNSQTVTFSHSGGFYDNSFSLELSCDEAYHIRYTTNGDKPTADSPLYVNPLYLNEAFYSPSNIFTILNCDPSDYHPVDDVERVVVIRAAAFNDADSCVSQVKTNTYMIHSLGCDLHNLPVLSIVTDSLSLFDYDTGIFVPGASYDTTATGFTGNYCNHGSEWERRINLEFYEHDNTGINQECGLRTHGAASRWFHQKGLKLYAREEYGKKRFKHRFFDNSYHNSFKHLILRPFRCSNWLHTGAQDYIANRMAANLDIDAMAVREVVVFINGEYWGIYTLEESPDERYFEDHYNADVEKVNVMKYWSGVPDQGDPADWQAFFRWIKTADLTLPEDSLTAFTRIDMSNFIDYMLFQLYTANIDWPFNNVRIWQMETGEQFRFIFYDGDGCLTKWNYNAVYNAINAGDNSRVFNHFLENNTFRCMFYNRYLELKRTHLSYNELRQYVDYYNANVRDEVTKQSERFGFPQSLARYDRDIDTNYVFIAKRMERFEQELNIFGLLSVDEIDMTYASCYPNPSSGRFTINIGVRNETAVNVEVFNCLGQQVFARKHELKEGDNTLDMNLILPHGVYFIKIANSTQRVIIQ